MPDINIQKTASSERELSQGIFSDTINMM